MFIKATTNSAGQTYYHLVESYRLNGKVKHRTLLSLGKAGEDRMDELIAALSKHKEILTILEWAKSIEVKDTYILGPLLVLERLFEKSGINDILESITGKHPKLEFDLRGLVFTLAASRFVRPGSKLKVFEHWQKRFYPEMVTQDIGLHQLYRTLDLLAEHKDEIEKALFWRDRDLLNREVDVILYDLTTLRFESTRTDLGALRQFGYSKERRSDCTQVVLGLLVTPEGIPIGFEVYPGNTFEGKTIQDIVATLREKFSIVNETKHEEDRCIITWSRVRAERDRKAREDVLDKIRKKLSKKKITAKEFVSNTTYQRYVVGLNDNKEFTLNEKAIAQDAMRDGYFGVVTNVMDMDAKEIVENYKTLWIVEDAFGEVKGTLRARPIFHWTDPRIVGHLTLCFIAYYCESLMTKALREKKLMLESRAIDENIIDPRPLTVLEAMRELQEVRAIPVKVRSTTMWVRTDINGNAHKLFSAIGLKPPPKVLRLTKSENVVAQA